MAALVLTTPPTARDQSGHEKISHTAEYWCWKNVGWWNFQT